MFVWTVRGKVLSLRVISKSFELRTPKYSSQQAGTSIPAASKINKSEEYFLRRLPSSSAVNLQDEALTINRVWLRHHCRCSICFNPVTHQRRTGLSRSIFQNSEVRTVKSETGSPSVWIEWIDDHKSTYDLEWLQRNTPKPENVSSTKSKDNWPWPQLETKQLFQYSKVATAESINDSRIDYADFMENDSALKQFFKNIIDTGFGMITNSTSDLNSIRKVHNRIAHPHRSFFGDGVSVATSDMKYNDTAYTSEPLALHTDTTYFTEPMGLQSFHVLHHDGTGGLNSFADGFHAAKLLHEEDNAMYSNLSMIPVPGDYFDPGRYHYSSLGLTFTHNLESGKFERIRFNPLDMGVLSGIPLDKTTDFYEAMVRLSELLEEQRLWLQLSPGSTLFIDNWRILHGRSGFTGSRSMASAYFPRPDWLSRARVVGALQS